MSKWTTRYTVVPARLDHGNFFRVFRQVEQGGLKERLNRVYDTEEQASCQIVDLIKHPTLFAEDAWMHVVTIRPEEAIKVEDSASHCDYYQISVTDPQNPRQTIPYVANTEDLIQALHMTFDEGCEFKSIVRRCNARLGFVKAETTPVRDAAKSVHYAQRVLRYEERKETDSIASIRKTFTDRAQQRLDDAEAAWKGHPATGCSSCHGSGLNIHGHKCFCRGTN